MRRTSGAKATFTVHDCLPPPGNAGTRPRSRNMHEAIAGRVFPLGTRRTPPHTGARAVRDRAFAAGVLSCQTILGPVNRPWRGAMKLG